MNKFMILTTAIVLASCAKRPDAISASYISDIGYQNYTCQQLAEENRRVVAAYTTAAQQQNNARTNDTLGVLLIGLPVSSLSGDNIAPEIARLKGEANAIHRASVAKSCNAQ